MNTFADKAKPRETAPEQANQLGMADSTAGHEGQSPLYPALGASRRKSPAAGSSHDFGGIAIHGSPRVARKCECGGTCPTCAAQEEPQGVALKRKHPHGRDAETAPAIVGEVVRSPGRPLDPETRALFEPRFGFDFRPVKVHTDARAAESAHAVHAVAYAVGQDVVFGSGQYTPRSAAGRELLAHELTHVVQNSRNPLHGTDGLPIVPAHDPSEREADRTAAAVLQTGEAAVPGPPSGAAAVPSAVRRQEAPEEAEAPQSVPAEESAETAPGTQPEETAAAGGGGLIVDDEATQVGPGQMHKSEFLSLLHDNVCATADDALAASGRTAQGCPYIERWIGFYRDQPAAHVERALRKYAPEAASITSARDYIPVVGTRVRLAVSRWVATGEITGVPEELADEIPGGGIPEAVGGAISSAASSVAEGISSAGSAIGGIFGKAREGGLRAGDPASVQAGLGDGQPLGAEIRSRMEPVFGHDFSRVRVHAGEDGARLSDRLNARAFTVGEHVAFGTAEYQPGTLVGDAIIAHELAHVVQQSGAAPGRTADGSSYDSLEEDADDSAVGAVVSLWQGTRQGLADVGRTVLPRLKSGLRLQRCGKKTEEPAPTPTPSPKGVAACGATFSLANQKGSGAKPAAAIGISLEEGIYKLTMQGIAPPNYQPQITIHAGSDPKAKEYEVGIIQNILSTHVEYTFTAGGPIRWPLPTPMKDGAPGFTGFHDDVFAENGQNPKHPNVLLSFAKDGDTVSLNLPDTPSDEAAVKLTENDECAGSKDNGTMTRGLQNDFFRTWVGVRHKPTNCVTTIHHIDWNVDYSADVNGTANPPTRAVTSNALNVTVDNGDGSPKFLQGAQVPADLGGNRVCGGP
jgi:hypothetical protein